MFTGINRYGEAPDSSLRTIYLPESAIQEKGKTVLTYSLLLKSKRYLMIKNNEFLFFKALKVETAQISSILALRGWSWLPSDTDIFLAFRHKCKLLFREMENHLQMERDPLLTEQKNCLVKARGWTRAHFQQMKETTATQLQKNESWACITQTELHQTTSGTSSLICASSPQLQQHVSGRVHRAYPGGSTVKRKEWL